MLSRLVLFSNSLFLSQYSLFCLCCYSCRLSFGICSILKVFYLQEMGLLEVKHGLLQIAESLEFLHSNARLIHRAIAPEVRT